MYTVTLIPGDGTGPEIIAATTRVIEATGVSIKWETVEAGADVIGKYGTPLPDSVLESVKKNKVALKGPITTPIGSGFRSVNVALRRALDLYSNIRPARTIEGVKTPFGDIDLVIVRENTEDLYAGVEHYVGADAAESIKIITRKASMRIAKTAFEYAVKKKRKRVTAVTKANILKYSDGLFLECARETAKNYPGIAYDEKLIDNMCMQLVMRPDIFDVLLLPNLYGDIVSDLCAGLIGGLGVAPGANIGDDYAVFEAVHGSAPKYKGLNKINPTAIILSGVMMLEYLGETKAAERLDAAVRTVIAAGGEKVTCDLGGTATTEGMADAIIEELKKER